MVKNRKKEYLTPNETAELLLISPVTVRQLAQKGDLPAKVTPGGHRRFSVEDIENYALSKGISLNKKPGQDNEFRVLIVDDDQQLRNLLVDVITSRVNNAIIEIAEDGFEAGQKVIQFMPDAILLDIMMPGINGIEVCKSIRSNNEIKHINIIAMTGYYSRENVNAMLEAGANACLEKPLNFDYLFAELGLDTAKVVRP